MVKMKIVFISSILILLFLCAVKTTSVKSHDQSNNSASDSVVSKENTWVFIMAGQSNMAGRGAIEPQDTVSNTRILTINLTGDVVIAKEPLHMYEPNMAGLDCGVYFARELLMHLPDSISVLLIPTAVGGSSIDSWLDDSMHRGVKLLSNFRDKVNLAKNRGMIKAILWHQGESDAKIGLVNEYSDKLNRLFVKLRSETENDTLPILTGQIGLFADGNSLNLKINKAIDVNSLSDSNTFQVTTGDFVQRGDKLHFNSQSQRLFGNRLADKYLEIITNKH
jgi:hypothetical protein